jgi:hypothetical protein
MDLQGTPEDTQACKDVKDIACTQSKTSLHTGNIGYSHSRCFRCPQGGHQDQFYILPPVQTWHDTPTVQGQQDLAEPGHLSICIYVGCSQPPDSPGRATGEGPRL